MAFMMGSIAQNVAGLLDSPAMAKVFQQLGGRQGLTDALVAALLGWSARSSRPTGYPRHQAAHRGVRRSCRGSPGRGHTTEPLGRQSLSTRAGRVAWLLLVAGVANGLGLAVAVGDPSQVRRVALAGLTRSPAAWLMVALVFALWGTWPQATGLGWGAYAAFIAVGELGPLWGVPAWVTDLSPFAHTPVLPGPDAELAGLLLLTVVAAGLIACGYAAFRHRDLTAQVDRARQEEHPGMLT